MEEIAKMNTDAKNPEAKKDYILPGSTTDENVPWYSQKLGSQLTHSTRTLLEKYSHIPSSEVESHIYSIRQSAWKIHPYPCIGQFRFLDLAISLSPHYTTILSRLLSTTNSQPEILLDIGCCFGQELRKLISEGVSPSQLYGIDLRPDFFELGYELFRDKETMNGRFFGGDFLADEGSQEVGFEKKMGELKGKVDIIWAASFLHLFGYEKQVEICTKMVRILSKKPGSGVFGRQVGTVVAKERDIGGVEEGRMFMHNCGSFEKMWREVGEMTGSKWRVESVLRTYEEDGRDSTPGAWQGQDLRLFYFGVFREE